MKRYGAVVLLWLFSSTSGLLAQQSRPGHEFADYIAANEKFGHKLLKQAHDAAPNQNVVVAPLSISILFAAIGEYSSDSRLQAVFEWKSYRRAVPSRMLMSALAKPAPAPRPRKNPNEVPPVAASPEELWISNELVYRNVNAFNPYWLKSARTDFGITSRKLMPADNNRFHGDCVPGETPCNDFWIASRTHARSIWAQNTGPGKGQFTLASGETEKIDTVGVALEPYLHAKNDSFEAVIVPLRSCYFLIILAAPGKDIHDLENELVQNPATVDASLAWQVGSVTFPALHLEKDNDVFRQLQRMGVPDVAQAVSSIIQIPGSHLRAITQKVSFEVDYNGLRADADTVMSGVYGGILRAPNPFKMIVDRPYIFLVRDKHTDGLLFIGAVMDPLEH